MAFQFKFNLRMAPRFVSFDVGVIVGLLAVGAYLAIHSRHWIAAAFLLLAMVWTALVPLKLRRATKSTEVK